MKPSFHPIIPEGDTYERDVCSHCGWINYVNPKIVVGSVALWEDKILLCKRAIAPRLGFWTLPAGYLEVHETTEAGAAREAQEEACANTEIRALLAVYNLPHISQVQIIYLSHLKTPEIAPGPESLEVTLYKWDDIPWNFLAFPSVRWALDHYNEIREQQTFVPFSTPRDTA